MRRRSVLQAERRASDRCRGNARCQAKCRSSRPRQRSTPSASLARRPRREPTCDGTRIRQADIALPIETDPVELQLQMVVAIACGVEHDSCGLVDLDEAVTSNDV